MKKVFSVFLCAVFAAAFLAAQTVETSVSAVDKYGNATLAISAEEFAAAGFEAGDFVALAAGEAKFEKVPVGSNYSDVNQGELLVRVQSGAVQAAVNMGNFAKKANVAEGSAVSISMAEKGGYLTQFQLRQLKKSESRADYASDEIFANFREAKGGKLAAGRLFRSCNPALGDARAPYANALAEKAGVKTVINLADTAESAAANFDKAKYYAGLAESGNVVFLNMGVDFSDAEFQKKLKDGLSFLAEHADGPYLVHCNEGKDRAGFVVSILEALCGATISEIKADYIVSFENYFGVEKGSEQHRLISQIVADQFATLNGGKAVAEKGAQKVAEKYLIKKVGLTKAQIAAIKKNLM